MGKRAASRTSLSSVSSAFLTSSMQKFSISSIIAGSGSFDSNSNLGLPISATIPFIKATTSRLTSWPFIMASNITSSGISLPPASIIATKSAVEETVKSRVETARCSSVGLITISPSTMPTFTLEIGPSHGISEIAIAAETPMAAATSGLQSGSTDITVATTVQSLRISFGKSGRIGRSIQREARTALSVALPSRFVNEPGIRPTEYIFSS